MASKQKVGAFWKRTGKTSGKEFYSGKIEVDGIEIDVVMFPNGYKKENKHPDLIVYRQEDQNYQQNDVNEAVNDRNNYPDYPEDEIDPDDIPF